VKEDEEEKFFKADEDWALSWDSLSVSVHESRINKKTGNISWVVKGHYPNFETAIQGLVDKSLMSEISLEKIMRRLKILKEQIPELVKEMNQWRYKNESRYKGKVGNPISTIKPSRLGKEERQERKRLLKRRRMNESK